MSPIRSKLSSIEDVNSELKVLLSEQKRYFEEKLNIYPYIQGLEFKSKFESIRPTVCLHCGREFRITHFCEIEGCQIWVPKWWAILHPLYERFLVKPYNRRHEEIAGMGYNVKNLQKSKALVIHPIIVKSDKKNKSSRKNHHPKTIGGLCMCIFIITIGFMILLRTFY